MSLQFSINKTTFELAKRALVFVEGTHTDSKGRQHVFDRQRIMRYVRNTNEFLRKGGRLPFQMDHKKTQDSTIGDVCGELYVKEIEPSDLPDPKYTHLIGKLGVFVDNLVGKGRDVVEKIKNGLIKTLSPGLDPKAEIFVEISATPTPAIIGPALFSRWDSDEVITFNDYLKDPKEGKIFSFDDSNNSKTSYDIYRELSEKLYRILDSIYTSTDEELVAAGVNPIEASYEAIEYFITELEKMFELVEPEEENYSRNFNEGLPIGYILKKRGF